MSFETDLKKAIAVGGLRRLTSGEINLAATLFGHTVSYNKVWIHRGSYLPFNLQSRNTAMTPNGEIWFQEGVYRSDFSSSDYSSQHMFLHEMMHVYQFQRGMFVKARGAFSWAVNYQYRLDKENLNEYGMEQQASLVSDYWLLINHGFSGHMQNVNLQDYNFMGSEKELTGRYKKILRRFPL
jgi:hypothetical protein